MKLSDYQVSVVLSDRSHRKEDAFLNHMCHIQNQIAYHIFALEGFTRYSTQDTI